MSQTNLAIAKNSRPLTTDQLLEMILKGTIDRTSVIPLGVNSDGTVVTAQSLVTRRVGRRNIISLGELHAYTITDLPNSITGTSFPTSFTAQFNAGNLVASTTFFTPTKSTILKSVIIVTSSVAGNRTLQFTAVTVSSKTVGPSLTGDLLDRELAMSPFVAASILNGDVGDKIQWTYITSAA